MCRQQAFHCDVDTLQTLQVVRGWKLQLLERIQWERQRTKDLGLLIRLTLWRDIHEIPAVEG